MSQAKPQSTAIVTSKTKEVAIKEEITKSQPAWSALLPDHLRANPDRMYRSFLMAAKENPLLFECTPKSVVLSIGQAAQLGIYPNGPEDHGWLIPYQDRENNRYDAQFQIGYRGLQMLTYNTGMVSSVYAYHICEHDHYDISGGTRADLIHKWKLGKRGKIIGAYGVATIRSTGENLFRVLDMDEIAEHRKHSQSAGSEYSPWNKHFVAMCEKTALREFIWRNLPLSGEKTTTLFQAIKQDHRQEQGLAVIPEGMGDFVNLLGNGGDSDPPKSRADALADKVGQGQ